MLWLGYDFWRVLESTVYLVLAFVWPLLCCIPPYLKPTIGLTHKLQLTISVSDFQSFMAIIALNKIYDWLNDWLICSFILEYALLTINLLQVTVGVWVSLKAIFGLMFQFILCLLLRLLYVCHLFWLRVFPQYLVAFILHSE